MSLSSSSSNTVVVLCIGNREGGDDGVGPYIADKLGKLRHDVVVIDCGVMPENYTSVVKKNNANVVVLIDAVEMNLNAGEIRSIDEKKVGVMHISTHGIPLSVLMKYLKEFVGFVVFIGIQPKCMSGKMSSSVKKSADKCVELIKNKNFSQIQPLC